MLDKSMYAITPENMNAEVKEGNAGEGQGKCKKFISYENMLYNANQSIPNHYAILTNAP